MHLEELSVPACVYTRASIAAVMYTVKLLQVWPFVTGCLLPRPVWFSSAKACDPQSPVAWYRKGLFRAVLSDYSE